MVKLILISLGVALAGLLIYAALQPNKFRIARTASINAPPEKIYPLIESLRSGERWSPYYRKDPKMKGTYNGPETGEGSSFAFDGDKNVGSGRLTITDTSPPDRVTMRLQMYKPLAADHVVEFTLAPRGAATDVTWAMKGRQPFLGRVVCLFFNMDKMVGTDFETGLANLKAIAES